MLRSKEFFVVLLVGSFAIVFGRIDVRGFGRAGANLKQHIALAKNDALPAIVHKVHVGNINLEGIPEDQPDTPIAYEPFSPEQRLASRPAVGATPCKTAEQWEGRATEWDHLVGVNNRFNITFDGIHRRKRVMEDKHAQLPGRRIYEYIMLYDEGIQYVINHRVNTCTVEKLGTWRNFTIPPGSILEDFYEIGAPGSGFMVQEWSDRIPGRKKESWIGTFTDIGCWPVNEIFMERDENLTMIQSVSTKFFDLQLGIKDMSIFTPPPFCPQPMTTPTTTPDTQFTEFRRRGRPYGRRQNVYERRFVRF